MSKQVLSIEQMKHLQELGLNTSKASMCYVVDDCNSFNPILCISGQESEYLDAVSYLIPAFTLQDILDLLPKNIKDDKGFEYFLAIHIFDNNWNVVYSLYNEILVTINYFNSEYLIDAAYEMLCWCIKNKYIK